MKYDLTVILKTDEGTLKVRLELERDILLKDFLLASVVQVHDLTFSPSAERSESHTEVAEQ